MITKNVYHLRASVCYLKPRVGVSINLHYTDSRLSDTVRRLRRLVKMCDLNRSSFNITYGVRRDLE